MAELDVDGLPVELNKTQQKRVDEGEHESVAEDIRKLRREAWVALENDGERPPSYNDIAGDDE